MALGDGYICSGTAVVAGMSGTIDLYLAGGTKDVSHQSQSMSLNADTSELRGAADGVIHGMVATGISRTYRGVFTPTGSSKANALANAIVNIKPLAVVTIASALNTMYNGTYNVRAWTMNSDTGPTTIELELIQVSANSGTAYAGLAIVT